MSKHGFSIADDLSELVGEVVASTALDCHSLLSLATPKKSGVAQANWNVSIDGSVPSYKSGKTNVGNSLSEAKSLLGSDRILSDDLEVTISNQTPYIVRLNQGHSKQAGAFFVEKAIELAQPDGDIGD